MRVDFGSGGFRDFFLEKFTWLLRTARLSNLLDTNYKHPAKIHLQTSSSRLRKTGLIRPLAAVAATASALMTSQGAVIYSGVVNVSTLSTGGTYSLPNLSAINVDGQSASEFSLTSYGSKIKIHQLGSFSADFDFVGTSSSPTNHASGVSVGASSSFSSNANADIPSSFGVASNSYIGFRFNPSGSQTLYGWGQLSLSADSTTMTLVDYAYDDTGASILTAAVPEPSVSLLGLMGLTSVCFLRSRKIREVAG